MRIILINNVCGISGSIPSKIRARLLLLFVIKAILFVRQLLYKLFDGDEQ